MRWLAKDTSLYIAEKQYVDTLVVLLVPIAFGDRTKESGNDYEFLSLISSELERQFQGRILLFPPFIYPENPSHSFKEVVFKELFRSIDSDFRHLFFISTKQDFKEQIDAVNGELFWMPSIPLEYVDEKNRRSIIEDQVRQLSPLIVQRWQEEERKPVP